MKVSTVLMEAKLAFVALVITVSDFANAGQAGGYSSATAEEIAPGSHCYVLASYAIEQLKAQSNSLHLMQNSCANNNRRRARASE